MSKRVKPVLMRLMGGIQTGEEQSTPDSRFFALHWLRSPGKRSSSGRCLHASTKSSMTSFGKPEGEEVRLCSACGCRPLSRNGFGLGFSLNLFVLL